MGFKKRLWEPGVVYSGVIRTVDRQFLLRVNRRTLVDVDIPYTKADWMDTEPVELELKEGRNQILYTHKPPNKGLSIKYFTLRPVSEM